LLTRGIVDTIHSGIKCRGKDGPLSGIADQKVLKGGQRAWLRRKRKLFALKKDNLTTNENNQAIKDSPLSLSHY